MYISPYFTERPSMTIAEVKALTNCGNVWPLFEEQEHGRYYFADGEAIDLTRKPRLYVALPARM